MTPKFFLPGESPSTQLDGDRRKLDEIFQNNDVDPFEFVAEDLRSLSRSMGEIIGSDHPVIKTIAKYFFDSPGKRLRPAILFAVSRALNADSAARENQPAQGVMPPQERLAQITELIHTASLLHDDVIDDATSRRGVPSINKAYGNKLAILGGDFLLARASVALARLKDPVVIEIMSTVIEHLVKGEVMQYQPRVTADLFENIDYYLTKTFYKTASLIAGSSKSVAILGGHSTLHQDVAFEYGKNLGLAFQIIDDILDFSGSVKNMGKPVLSDLSSGVVTAPVLYAAQSFPQLRPMIDRKFKQAGDVQQALEYIEKSGSVESARQLAVKCCLNAAAAVLQLQPSQGRTAALAFLKVVLDRDR